MKTYWGSGGVAPLILTVVAIIIKEQQQQQYFLLGEEFITLVQILCTLIFQT
jgi:hypothetical protein